MKKNFNKAELNEEIRSLTQLVQTLTSEGLLNPDESIEDDIRAIEAKRDEFANLRTQLAASGLNDTNELYQKTLNQEDKEAFIWLVTIVLKIRKFLGLRKK